MSAFISRGCTRYHTGTVPLCSTSGSTSTIDRTSIRGLLVSGAAQHRGARAGASIRRRPAILFARASDPDRRRHRARRRARDRRRRRRSSRARLVERHVVRLAPCTVAAATIVADRAARPTTHAATIDRRDHHDHDDRRTTPPTTSPSPTSTRSTAGSRPSRSTATGHRPRVRAEHDVPAHDDRVRRRDGALVKTIPDSVDLAQFGIAGHPGISRGAPVEAAVDHAHQYVFASQLLDVRRQLRSRGLRQLRRARRPEPELRLPREPEDARDRRGRSGRHGARSTSPSPPTTSTCSSATGAATT